MDHYSSPSVFNISGTWQGTHASGSAQVHQGPQINVYQHGGLMRVLASEYDREKNRNPKRTPGTCQWVLRHEKFVRWRDNPFSAALWVSAEAGAGKSVLSRALVDERLVCSKSPAEPQPTICYFFFKDGDTTQNTGEAALCALLHQLLLAKPSAMVHAIPIFKMKGDALRGSLDDQWAILEAIARDPTTGSVICIVDALDECEKTSRNYLIGHITAFMAGEAGRSANIRFLMTSRPYPEIDNIFRRNTDNVDQINIRPEDDSYETVGAEINVVIAQRVADIFGKRQYRPSDAVQHRFIAALQARKNRTYLWVSLVLEDMDSTSVLDEDGFYEFIAHLPLDLKTAYLKLLNRILPQYEEEARNLFNIVLETKRPLSLEEMDIALAIANGQLESGGSHASLKLKGSGRLEEHLRALSSSLVIVSNGFVYLLHQTLREFLMDDRRSKACHWEGSFDPKESHYLLSKICMTYLLVNELNTEAERIQPKRFEKWLIVCLDRNQVGLWELQFPCLIYSREHWHWHYQRCQDDGDSLVALGEQLCHLGRTIGFQLMTMYRPLQNKFKTSTRRGVFRVYPAQPSPLEVALRYEVPLLVEAMIRRGAITSPKFLAKVAKKMISLKFVNMVKILITKMTPEDRYKSLYFACGRVIDQASAEMIRCIMDTGVVKPDSACLMKALSRIGLDIYDYKLEPEEMFELFSILKLLLDNGADETLLDEASRGQIQLFLAMDSRDLETASPIMMELVHNDRSLVRQGEGSISESIVAFGDSIWGETDRWLHIRRQMLSAGTESFRRIYGVGKLMTFGW